MSIQKKELDYAKETGDVMVLAAALVADIKAGKTLPEISGDVLPKFMEAVSAADQIPAEEKASRKAVLATIGYHTGELADALIG